VHPVHHDPSIALLYLLHYSTAELPFVVDIQGKPHHCPRRTLWPTDRNMDGAANLVDEEHFVEAMENAIDYDGAVAVLNLREQAIVAELMKRGGGKCDEHRKKQKCECHDGDQKWGAH
jgi:hypothetical protein